MKTSREIRQEFIDFFKKHGHTFVPSSPVVAHEDPTLMFTNAGMNQFKDVFLETGTRPYKRAANSQKCIRVSGKHNDLEEVGHDNYHHTYFEMLGNWSFGDYFKEEAIRWAWELLTEVWGLPPERLYATVFGGDEADGVPADTEAEELWKKVTGIDPTHVLRFDKKDNFWEMGEVGPCGPCSEIHIDMTPDLSGGKLVNTDDPRVIEIWNLVFIQYNREKGGRLKKLPAQHVDTGMGFERVVRVLQNVHSNYETDVFQPIIDHVSEIANIDYKAVPVDKQAAFQVIADHIRMLTFSISDGEIPASDGRGYVLRRILRRAALYGRKLDMHEPFIYQLVPTVVEINGEAFPEIVEKQSYVMEVIKAEEESFNRTLDRGLERFDEIAGQLLERDENTISGEEVFKLYDTYGFPVDLTRVIAAERGLTVDEAGFETAMAAQRERARKAGKFSLSDESKDDWQIISPVDEPRFGGYNQTEMQTRIHKIARRNGHYHVVLTETPFYAEAGGQVGDTGQIIGEGFLLQVTDTQKEGGANVCICTSGPAVDIHNAEVRAVVDRSRRDTTTYNHTATHLLHAALRKVLGEHVSQKGSLVAPDHLRFDFSHFRKMEREELESVENIVNEQIQADLKVDAENTDFNTAKSKGAMALFGEKYGEVVRMVSIAPVSVELCGGCHVKHTGQIGAFIIVQETSVASGVRRIEALTGPKAVTYIQHQRAVIQELDQLLNVPREALAGRVQELLEDHKQLEKQLQQMQAAQVLQETDQLIADAEKLGDISLVTREFHDADVDLLKQLGDDLRSKATATVGFFVNHADGRVNFVCAVTDDLIQKKKISAGNLVKAAAQLAGGGGGGRPHLATAGAKSAGKLPEVYSFLRETLAK